MGTPPKFGVHPPNFKIVEITQISRNEVINFWTLIMKQTADHIDNNPPGCLAHLLAERVEDITAILLEQLEGHVQVMVLQYRLIIIEMGQLGTCQTTHRVEVIWSNFLFLPVSSSSKVCSF
jgi:hypothetical protein